MIYLSKLAKRLALGWGRASGVLVVIHLASCSSPQERDFLSPNPGTPAATLVGISISPRDVHAAPGEPIHFTATGVTNQGTSVPVTVLWTASGGVIQPDGTFTPDAIGRYRIRATQQGAAHRADSVEAKVYTAPTDILEVQISPDSQEVGTGESLRLVARAELGNGSTVLSPPLGWAASGGQVDGNGWFQAPETAGVYTVLAKAPSGAEGRGTVKVKTTLRTLTGITVSPKLITVAAGRTEQFSASGLWSNGGNGPVGVVWSSTGGGISGTGAFTAGSTAGHFRVVARQVDGSVADTAVVTVTEPSLVGITVSPSTSTLTPSAQIQVTAQGQWSDGSTRTVGAAWQASGGSVTTGGVFTAPALPGSYRVIATVAGTPFADTMAVTVSLPVATLTSLILNPGTVSVPAGTSRQFAVVATWSDGSVGTPQLAWEATGGTITSAGVYTAGASEGIFRVIAREVASGKADTSTVAVTEAVLQSLVLNPSSVTLSQGQTRQFQVAGLWSDGGTAPPAVTWFSVGGSITPGGLYTAGATPGTWPLIATHVDGPLADTAYVTIDQPPPTLLALTLTPASVTVAPAGTVQFAVGGTWSSGGSGIPSATYLATGGTISASGLYTAGGSPGGYRVIATHTGGVRADTSTVVVSQAAPALVSLLVSPKPTTVQAGGTRQFAVSALWSDGSTVSPGVNWSAAGGTITNGGLYLAPNSAGNFLVVAAHAGGTLRDTVPVTVTLPPQVVALRVTPDSVSLASSGTQAFGAVAVYDQGGTATVPVTWSATGGTVNASGVYTAGGTAGRFRVIGTGQSTGHADTAVVVIQAPPPPVVTSFVMTPGSASVQVGGTVQFATSATWSDGVPRSVAVSFSATGGSISSGGLFTAGSQVGTFLVIAACGCGVSDTTAVAVTAAPPTPVVTGFVLSPPSATVQTGGTVQFMSTATWSDGVPRTVSVAYSSTGGTITQSGLFTAGSQIGSFLVIAACECGVADTSTVVIQAAAQSPIVTAFVMMPGTATVQPGGTVPFSTAVTWSDGQPHPATISYSATGGTITSTGLFTAGGSIGNFLVIASCNCGPSDTSTVTIQASGGGGVVYFEEDWSSGNFSKTQNGFKWGGRSGGSGDAAPIVTTTNPFPGKGYSAQFQFGGSSDLSDDAWSELRMVFGAPLTEYYLRIWLYFPADGDTALGTAGYYHRDPGGSTNNKFWTSWSGSYSDAYTNSGWETRLTLGASPPGGSRIFPKYQKRDPVTGAGLGTGQQGMRMYDPFIHLTTDRGRWMKVQMHVKVASSLAASDGIIEMWKDGVLVQRAAGIPNAAFDPANNGHTDGYILGWMNSGFNQTTRIWLGPVKMASMFIPD